jgi:hypothetical protein
MRRIQLISIVLVAALAGAAGIADAQTATHTLQVKIAGNGSGKINGSSIDCWAGDGQPVGPCTITEVAGNSVTLTAASDKGSVFAGWSGGGCSGTGACTVVLNSDTTVFARFVVASVSASGGTLPVSSTQHTASLPMSCHGPGTCYGSVQLTTTSKGKTTTLASSRYTIGQGHSARIKLRFGSGAIATIAKNHNRLRATLMVAPIDGQIKSSTVTLKLA